MNLIERLFVKYYMTPARFSRFLIAADESKAYGEVTRKAFGISLGQFNLLPKSQLDALLSLLNSNDNVLDVGCGNGRITGYISDKVMCRIKGIDFAEEAIRKAIEKHGNDRVSFETMKIEELTNVKDTFSKIIAIDSLYFFQDLKPIIKSFINLLSPDGKIIVFFSHNARSHGDISRDLIEETLSHFSVSTMKVDFTKEEIQMWNTLKEELEKRKYNFRKEGNMSLFRARYMESKSFAGMARKGKLKRFMYVITSI